MNSTQSRDANITLLADKIRGIRFAMLTTLEPDGKLISRPMATQATDFAGTLWFFTSASAPKVNQAQNASQVNVAYAKPDADRFISVAGMAQIVRDRQKMHDLWQPLLSAWFPKGADDPDLALLQITVESADLWEGSANTLTRLTGLAKNAIAPQPDQGAEQKLDFQG